MRAHNSWLITVTEKLTKEDQEKISEDEYELGTIRVFVSYSSDDKYLAGDVKRILEQYGLTVFLAHDDIEPTFEWQTEIIKNLNECDVFIPILTRSFSNSEWTDQEVGMAFGLEKLIIPLKVDTDPYGFISKIQACKLDVEKPSRTCLKIINVLKVSKFRESLIDSLLHGLEEANSFASANQMIEVLKDIENLTGEQINHIVRIAIRNNQVRFSNQGIKFLKSIIDEHTSKLDVFLVETYLKVKDTF